MSLPIPELVEILWVDSLVINHGEWCDWEETDDCLNKDSMLHRSAGYVIKESDDALVMALSINYDQSSVEEDSDRRYACTCVIPKRAILERTVFRQQLLQGSQDATSKD